MLQSRPSSIPLLQEQGKRLRSGQSCLHFTQFNDGQAQIDSGKIARKAPEKTNLSFPPSRHVLDGRGCGRDRDLPFQLAVDLGRQSSSSCQLVDKEGESILAQYDTHTASSNFLNISSFYHYASTVVVTDYCFAF